jgi:drug/metabolite transporter (DMT)-like permease
MASAAKRTGDVLVIFAVPLFFATNVVIGRSVATEVGPWTLACLRWSLAFLILLPFAAAGLRESWNVIRAQSRPIALLGFLGMFICGGVVYLALHYTTATNATLIYTSANVMILILEWLFRGRKAGTRELFGTALALGGVAVVTLGGEEARGFSLNPGDLLIGLAAFSWAIYSVLLKRPRLTQIPGLPLFAAIAAAGTILLLPMMLWELATGPALPQGGSGWLAVVAVALIPSVGAYSGYQYGVRRFGPTTMAMSSYLWPPYGLLLAVVFLGEAIQPHHVLGICLILPGVILATTRRQKAA